jgi:prephenate dehydratase
MAIENSIAGPIIPNYALIDKHNLHIIGEHYLRFIKI